ncbi:MAG: hypothetical protein LBL52_01305 [Rickettsiales bacterium]|jgi:hypothetical protein|nr:hypothetical protein [Rickettsiales bacterium]
MKKTSLIALLALLAACGSKGGSDDDKPSGGLPDIGGLPSVAESDVVAFSATNLWEAADISDDASWVSVDGDSLVYSFEGEDDETAFKLDSFKKDSSKGYYISEKSRDDEIWYAKIENGKVTEDSDTPLDGYVKITDKVKEALVLGGKANGFAYVDFGYWAEGYHSTGTGLDVSVAGYESFAGGLSSKLATEPATGTFKGKALGGVNIDSQTIADVASKELIGTVEFTLTGGTLAGQVVFPDMYTLNLNNDGTVGLATGNTSNSKFNIDGWTKLSGDYSLAFFGPSADNATEATGDFGYRAKSSDDTKIATIVGAFGAKKQ